MTDHDHNTEMMTSHLIETTDEEGKTHVFEKLDEYDIDGQRYALMIYVGEQEGGSTLEQAARQLAEQLGTSDNGATHSNKEEAEAVVAAMSAAQKHEHAHEHGEGCCDHNHDDEDGYEEELVVMRVVTDEDGEEIFEAIEDDAEFEAVVSAIEAMSENGELAFDVLDDEAVSNN